MPDTLLVVDDSRLMRRHVALQLATNYVVVEAADGIEAISILREQRIALVLCDLTMPRMGGLELLDVMHATCSRVPIVLLSSEVRPKIWKRAQARGARAWVNKPPQAGELMRIVESVLGGSWRVPQ